MSYLDDLRTAAMGGGTPGSALESVAANTVSKQQEVAAVAAQKKQDLAKVTSADLYRIGAGQAMGTGAATATGVEADLRQLSPAQLFERYGDAAGRMVQDVASANRSVQKDLSAQRNGAGIATDAAISVGLGLANAVGGIAALGAGFMDERAGTALATGLKKLNDFGQSTQTDALQARRRIQEAANNLDTRDNAAESDGSLMGSLKRIGKDTIGAVKLAVKDPTILADGIAQGVGSLLAAAPVSRGAAALGAAKRFAVPAAIGAMEGGGAYQQTAADVMGQSFENLQKNSPMYRDMVAQGVAPEEARQRVANRTGQLAAAVQGPVGVATGALVSKFEGNPFATPSARAILGNLTRETVEEGIQGGTGQLAQNAAQKTLSNENQDLAEGVGAQIGQGALYGLGAAGVTQGPGAAGVAVDATLTQAARGLGNIGQATLNLAGQVGDAVDARVDAVRAKNEAASPVSFDNLQAQSQATAAAAPVAAEALAKTVDEAPDMPEEQKTALVQAGQRAYVANQVSDDDINSLPVSEELKASLRGSGNLTGMVQNLVDVINSKDASDADKEAAVHVRDHFIGNAQKNTQDFLDAAQALPEDHEFRGYVEALQKDLADLQSNASVKRAQAATQEIALRAAKDLPAIDENTIDMPESQAAVQKHLLVAQNAPDQADLESLDKISRQAKAGKVNLDPRQKTALEAARAMLRGAQAYNDAREAAAGGVEKLGRKDKVTLDISTNDQNKEGKFSAFQHAARIAGARNAGDTKSAQAYLQDFKLFVEHMKNKVDALNKHAVEGNNDEANSVQFQALAPTGPANRKWYAGGKLGVDKTKPGSVKFAKTVGAEASMVATVYNGLAEGYPELGFKPVSLPQLNPLLDGTVTEVVSRARESVAAAKPTKEEQDADVEQSPTTTATQDNEPVVAESEQRGPDVRAVDAGPRRAETPAGNEAGDQAGSEAPAVVGAKQDTPDQRDGQRAGESAPAGPEATDTQPALNQEKQEEKTPRSDLADDKNMPNMFKKAFKSVRGSSRLADQEKPATFVLDALKNQDALTAVAGTLKKRFTDATAKAYRDLIRSQGSTLLEALNTGVESALDQIYGGGESLREKFLKGDRQVNRIGKGKVLNLLNTDATLNNNLASSAVLATIQWRITSPVNTPSLEAKAVPGLFGAPDGFTEDEVSAQTLQALRVGRGPREMLDALANKITQFWGMKADSSVDDAYVKGIPLSVAAQMLQSLEDAGELRVDKYELGSNFGVYKMAMEIKNGKPVYTSTMPAGVQRATNGTADRYVLKEQDVGPIAAFPDAIEVASLAQPEQVLYFGDDTPSIPDTVLNNPAVQATATQKEMMKRAGQIKHRWNPRTVSLWNAIGKEGMVQLLANGQLDTESMNINDLASKEGQNLGIAAAFDRFVAMQEEITSVAEAQGVAPEAVDVRYGWDVTAPGRLQMRSSYNPQASKLMREVMLPTHAVLDLTDPDHQSNLTRAIAQGLGVKVHKEPNLAVIDQKLQDELTKFPEAVEAMQDFLDTGKLEQGIDPFRELTKNHGALGLHALMDYLRSQGVDGPFETALYLEADGVTNGVANALMMFMQGVGKNTLENLRRVGVFFQQGLTANDFFSTGAADTYGTVAGFMQNYMGRQKDRINPEVVPTLEAVRWMMSKFLDKPLTIADDGTVKIDRGVVKNPLTIAMYGSGEVGIAGNIIKEVMENIYARMSEVSAAREADPTLTMAEALFPGSNSEADLKAFVEHFNLLTNNEVRNFEGQLSLSSKPSPVRKGVDPKTFTLGTQEEANMRTAFRHLFVAPLKGAMAHGLGQELFQSMDLVQRATNLQSAVAAQAYQEALARALESKKESADWRAGDFLSQDEQKAIFAKIKHLYPMLELGHMNLLPGSSGQLGVDARKTQPIFGMSLNSRHVSDATVYGPEAAGVRALSLLVQGSGDAFMIQRGINNGATGLPTFDGFSMGLDKVQEISTTMNEAAFEAMMNNPLKAVLESFSRFAKEVDLSSLGPKQYEALVKAVNGDPKEILATTLAELEIAVPKIDAAHAVMRSAAGSTDQMAGAQVPASRAGIEYATDEALANAINAATQKARPEEEASENISAELAQVGREHSTGARTIATPSLRRLLKIVKIPDGQRDVINRALADLQNQGYSITFGTADQLNAYQKATGKKVTTFNAGDQGHIHYGDKKIYLVNPSSETLAHEVLHASTFEKIYQHYNGKSSDVTKAAVSNMEKLLGQFLGMGDQLELASSEAQRAYQDAKNAILSEMNDETQSSALRSTGALNEFMAWALTNQSLNRLLERNQAHPLAVMGRKVINFIKKLIFGTTEAPAVGKDMLSNLRFNAAIVQGQTTMGSQDIADVMSFQSTAYGTDPRLADVVEPFAKMVASIDTNGVPSMEMITAINNAADLSNKVKAVGFLNTAQEGHVFEQIVMALATQAAIDPNSMQRIDQLFRHVTQNLSSTDLVANPEALDPGQEAAARAKYDFLLGKDGSPLDIHGRSALLPTFLALAMTDAGLRSALEKMEVPKAQKVQTDSKLDTYLFNTGTQLMEMLSNRAAGGDNSRNVKKLLDTLVGTVRQQSMKTKSEIEELHDTAQEYTNTLNDKVVEVKDRVTQALSNKADKVANTTNSKVIKALADSISIISKLASESGAAQVSQAVRQHLNQANGMVFFRELVSDLIGRTDENAPIFDMIKRVRSFVSQARQNYREEVPKEIAKQFTRKLTDAEWTAQHLALAKTDFAALAGMSEAETKDLLTSSRARAQKIKALETAVKNTDAKSWPMIQKKAKQLANFMNTGETGSGLLRNVNAVANLLDLHRANGMTAISGKPAAIQQLDQLISLYALDSVNQDSLKTLASLVQDQWAGVSFLMAYLDGQRKGELDGIDAAPEAAMNHYKGYVPQEAQSGMSLIVADDGDFARLAEQSYQRVGDYKGSAADPSKQKRGYYFVPVAARAKYNQGILQNVRQTFAGVDAALGYTYGSMTAGRIVDPIAIKNIQKDLRRETGSVENLMPVFDKDGAVVAYERSVDPAQLARLNYSTRVDKLVGNWRGRQVEEIAASMVNEELINKIRDQYRAGNKSEFVNLYDSTDPVIKDSLKLVTPETRTMLEAAFGEDFFPAHPDQVNDIIGYRSASVGDYWTGNSRFSPATQTAVKNFAVALYGNKAYQAAMNVERTVQNVVTDSKLMIVVKSIVVPLANAAGNVIQLTANGVPLLSIARSTPKKIAEIQEYQASLQRRIALETKLNTVLGNPLEEPKVRAEMKAIDDAHKRLSFYSLIQAGEFSAISDSTLSHEDTMLSQGRLHEYAEALASKLPPAVRTMGRYAVVGRDTALFQGMQKATEYGDFIAKTILFDHLRSKGMSEAQALAMITEEFVNYDRLSGRTRQAWEDVGMAWFLNFKIRSVKVAGRMLRRNPVNFLLSSLGASMLPLPEGVGTPVSDNLLPKVMDGSIWRAFGPGMGFRAGSLNPWWNLMT